MLPSKSVSHLFVSLLLAANIDCTTTSQQARTGVSPPQNQGAPSPSSRIKETWAERAGKLQNTKSYPAESLDILLALLDKLPGEQIRSEMEQLLAKPTAVSEMSEYEQTLLAAFVVRGIRQQDRELLRRVLSVKCPRYIAAAPVELYLAQSDPQFPDALLILFDSYKVSANEEARATLYEALSHFCGISRKDFNDDLGYISAVEDWYVKNKDRVKVNAYYRPKSPIPEYRTLFIER